MVDNQVAIETGDFPVAGWLDMTLCVDILWI
jgi:hypothetical protein